MMHKLAALTLIFGVPTLLRAQDATAPAEKPQTAAELDAEIESDIANAEVTSGHISVEAGIGLRKGLGPELRINWYRDDDQVYGLKLGQYSAKDVSDFDSLSLMSIGLQSRFSLEGSFFIEGGIDVALMKVKIDEAQKVSNSSSGTYGFEGDVSQTYFQLSFGNQWQTGKWTYGADWIDLYIPISGSNFSTSSSGTINDRETLERRDKKDFKTEAVDINYGISVHGGFVF